MTTLLEKLYALPEPEFSRDFIIPEITVTKDDIPELIDIAFEKHIINDATVADYNASIHAYRLLASLKEPTTINKFFELFDITHEEGNDYYINDFPALIASLGEQVVPELCSRLEDGKIDDVVKKLTYIDTLDNIIPDATEPIKSEIFTFLTDYLRKESPERELNAFICSLLADHKFTPALTEIQNIFSKHLADISFEGDLEEIEIKMGSRQERSTPSQSNWNSLETQSLFKFRKSQLTPPSPDCSTTLQLDYCLKLLGSDCALPNASSLDGFLVACCLAQNSHQLRNSIPWIWDTEDGEQAPTWDTPSRKASFEYNLMEHYLETHRLLSANEYEPVILSNDAGDTDTYFPWAFGFSVGLTACNAENDFDHIYDIIDNLHTDPKQPNKGIGKSVKHSKYRKIFRDRLSQDYANCKGGLSLHDHSTQAHTTNSTGRNEPCPCKSGKKHKKCCLNKLN